MADARELLQKIRTGLKPLEHRGTCFATAKGPSAQRTPVAFERWESAIIRPRRARLGRTAMSSGSSLDSARKPRSPDSVRRGAVASRAKELRFLLQ